jgi:hypothetical protein
VDGKTPIGVMLITLVSFLRLSRVFLRLYVPLVKHGLESAYLEGADLTAAQGVTHAQLDAAHGDFTTKLTAGLAIPESWKQQASG